MSNIVSIILILASIGLFFGYVDPAYSKAKLLAEKKAQYDNALNNSASLQAEREKLLKKYNAISEADRANLAKLLPDNIDNIRLVIDIDEMAKSHGMRIRNFKTDVTEKKDTIGKSDSAYGTLTMSFTTTATYATFLAFMGDLERSLRIIDVTGIQFSASDQSQLYDYTVTVKTYWLK
ncbi:MAG TPA: type 4a pilus biogenesis protein PilO [Candidatus Paceibacterota bacterium]|nr:type 4a pilus biogenesis protein PilO [Candidatus Paceibacterota bacterium]